MVFVKRAESSDETYDVMTEMGLNAKQRRPGLVGIEVEVEGKKLPKEPALPWVYHVDHSLRGAENAEYVLEKPIDFDEVSKAVDELWDLFRKAGATLDESNRTSVHVHLNVQKFYLNRLASLMSLYFVFEEVLTEWCGEHRVGNLFCLRAKDAPAIVSQIRRFIRTGMQAPIRDHHHYAGMNANALSKFGSLEFRALRGVSEPEIIKTWVSILQRLYELSEGYADPRDICADFSGNGPDVFFDTVLGDKAGLIRSGVEFNSDRIRDSMFEGIRLAQDICYARDWGRYKGVEYVADPFGRGGKKRLSGMSPVDLAIQEMELEEFGEEDEDMSIPHPPTMNFATAPGQTIHVAGAQFNIQQATTLMSDPLFN